MSNYRDAQNFNVDQSQCQAAALIIEFRCLKNDEIRARMLFEL